MTGAPFAAFVSAESLFAFSILIRTSTFLYDRHTPRIFSFSLPGRTSHSSRKKDVSLYSFFSMIAGLNVRRQSKHAYLGRPGVAQWCGCFELSLFDQRVYAGARPR